MRYNVQLPLAKSLWQRYSQVRFTDFCCETEVTIDFKRDGNLQLSREYCYVVPEIVIVLPNPFTPLTLGETAKVNFAEVD